MQLLFLEMLHPRKYLTLDQLCSPQKGSDNIEQKIVNFFFYFNFSGFYLSYYS